MMSKTGNPSRPGGRSGSGGFTPPSRLTGFLASFRSLFSPTFGLRLVPPQRLPELDDGYCRTLPGMPRRASAGSAPTQASNPTPTAIPMPELLPDSPEAHPLRRVAGSAGRWRKRLDEARQTWPLVAMDDLVATDGHLQKLAGLVQERYGLSHEAAEQEVREFLGPHDARP